MHTVIRFIRMIFVSETDSAKGSVLSSPWSTGGDEDCWGEEAAQRFSAIFSTQGGLSLHYNIVNLGSQRNKKKNSYSIQFWVNYLKVKVKLAHLI